MDLSIREPGMVKTGGDEIYEHGSGAGCANFLAQHGRNR